MRLFVKSALYGAIAAALLPTMLAVGIARRLAAAKSITTDFGWLMVATPFALALVFAVVAMLLVGIPARKYLRQRGAENGMGYVVTGVLTGLIVPLLLFLLNILPPGGEVMPLFGAIGGAAAGWTWWRGVRPAPKPAQ